MHTISSQMNIKFFIYWHTGIIYCCICKLNVLIPSAIITPNIKFFKVASFYICHNSHIL